MEEFAGLRDAIVMELLERMQEVFVGYGLVRIAEGVRSKAATVLGILKVRELVEFVGLERVKVECAKYRIATALGISEGEAQAVLAGILRVRKDRAPFYTAIALVISEVMMRGVSAGAALVMKDCAQYSIVTVLEK